MGGEPARSGRDRSARAVDLSRTASAASRRSTGDLHLSWFDLRQYAHIAGVTAAQTQLNYPYHSGDVAWIGDGRAGGMSRRLTSPSAQRHLRRCAGQGAAGLCRRSRAEFAGAGGTSRTAAGDGWAECRQWTDAPALHPDRLESESYGYVSAVRPNVTVRQFVAGGDDERLDARLGRGRSAQPADRRGHWRRPSRRFHLPVRRRGDSRQCREAHVRETAIYGALAVVTRRR